MKIFQFSLLSHPVFCIPSETFSILPTFILFSSRHQVKFHFRSGPLLTDRLVTWTSYSRECQAHWAAVWHSAGTYSAYCHSHQTGLRIFLLQEIFNILNIWLEIFFIEIVLTKSLSSLAGRQTTVYDDLETLYFNIYSSTVPAVYTETVVLVLYRATVIQHRFRLIQFRKQIITKNKWRRNNYLLFFLFIADRT